MTIQEFYEKISGNYSEAVGRMMKDSIVQRFVIMFLSDKSFDELRDNLESGNTEAAFRAAHTLKGVCKNLAFTRLAVSCSELTELLRVGNLCAARSFFPKVQSDYDSVVKAISEIC